jgi:replication fork protection complex subunit Tof1/Swi1
MNLFKTILDDQKSLPRDQPHKDLINLINFILRKFFKALAEEPFLAIEVCALLSVFPSPHRQTKQTPIHCVILQAFFPKNRNQWKQYSSWEPEEKVKRDRGGKMVEDTRFPPDVQVKKGFSWSEQLGIAIAALVEGGERELVDWVKDVGSLFLSFCVF